MTPPHASARVTAGIAQPTVSHDALEPADGGVERQAATVGRVGRVLVRVRARVRARARAKDEARGVVANHPKLRGARGSETGEHRPQRCS